MFSLQYKKKYDNAKGRRLNLRLQILKKKEDVLCMLDHIENSKSRGQTV